MIFIGSIPPDDFDVEAFRRSMAKLEATVPDTDKLRLTVTASFDDAVREATGDPTYMQSRDFAFAVAKTIPQDDGMIDLIVDARVFRLDAAPGDPERTVQHEALHVAMEHRGERLTDIATRHGFHDLSQNGVYAPPAALACEEYRIERVLCRDAPHEREDTHLASFATTAESIRARIYDASRTYARSGDIAAFSRALMEALHALATVTAYVAAEMHATGREPDIPNELGDAVLGLAWVELVDAFADIPPADQTTTPEELDAHAMRISAHLRAWTVSLGFVWKDVPAGLYLDAPGIDRWL